MCVKKRTIKVRGWLVEGTRKEAPMFDRYFDSGTARSAWIVYEVINYWENEGRKKEGKRKGNPCKIVWQSETVCHAYSHE